MPIFLVVAVLIAAVAAVYDVMKGEVPDWLTLGGLACGPLAHAAHAGMKHAGTEVALAEGGYSVIGVFACAFVPWILFRYSAIGGGDVKLFAALGAWCQTMIGVEALTYSFIAAVLIAPARLAYEGKLFRTLKNTVLLLGNAFLPKEKRKTVDPELMTWFRMGPAIFLGVVLATILHWREAP